MKKITVDAKAFADAMNKVSKVLRKSPLPIFRGSCSPHPR